jgi:ribosomal protein L11 methyltransferase
VADAVLDVLPATTYGQSAFKKDTNDRSADPLWTVQGLYDEQPDKNALSVELAVLSAAHGHGAYAVRIDQVPAGGWLKKNEESYPPIRVGRIVIHSAKDHVTEAHEKGIKLPIGAAFGTGEHPTTFGCLTALQMPNMLKRGMRMLDIGTGSGILAFAAAKLKYIKAVAGEMDAESVFIARENATRNGLSRFVKTEKAEGFRHRLIARHKPYPLIVSNIFAKPLAKLAPQMRRHLKLGGQVVLAGLLHEDAALVQSAYAAQRIHLKRHLRFGAWSILVLHRPNRATKLLTKPR